MGNSSLLFESIFNRKVSDEGIRDFLSQITKEYPYFSPAQFFLLSQSEKGTAAYAKQVSKTAILFNNAHWLNFQLEEVERNNTAVSEPIANQFNDFFVSPAPENSAVENNEIIETFDTINSNHTAQIAPLEAPGFIEPTFETSSENEINFNIPEVPQSFIEENIPVENTDIIEPFEASDSNYAAPIDIIEAPVFIEPTFETSIENKLDFNIPEEPQPVIQENMQVAEISEIETINEISINDDLTATVSTTEIINQPEAEPVITDTNHAMHFNNDDSPLVNESEEDEIILDEEVEPMKFRLNIDTNNVTEDTISFEPLHTSDYFASVGIKLSGEIQPTDKLGKQLKSFTEWLKTMKKIHSEQQAQQSDPAEITVQKLAEISNKEDVVITESMADVLLQQGKRKKAIEVYKKLSLLDSTKSAYFAAKIDQLKEH